jgi:CO/xanthine dehydrogenase Mo-binding subunit
MTAIGVSVPRVDGPAKVTGTAQYTADIDLPGMLHVKVLRSPYPHARVTRINASAAERLPGVVAVLTRDDLHDIHPYYGSIFKDQPIVAIDKVRHVGDVVAAVAAEERDVAEEALDLIEVDYEPLPAVFDPIEAMQPGAPLVHEQPPDTAGHFHAPGRFLFEGGNVLTHFHVAQGDVEVGFREADEVFEDRYTVPVIQHGHIEPHAATAYWEPTGKLVVYTASQNPSVVRDQLAEMFHLPASQVRLIVPFVGGGYGAKVHPRLEPLVAAMARKARRPVQLVLTREEVFYTAVRHAAVVTIRTGVKRDGTLVARTVETVYDKGAYASTGPFTTRNGGTVSGGPYRIPHQDLTAYCVYTHKPPACPFRGFGVPQVSWAYEQQMDDIARRLGMDAVELRLKNLLREGDTFVTDEPLTSFGLQECVEQVTKAIEWDGARSIPTDRPGVVRGRGVACAMKTTMTPSNSAASVRLNADGSAVLLTSSVEIGQGTRTSLAQVVAEVLGIPVDWVVVSAPDTDVTPYDQATNSSRTAFSMGHAALQAAGQIRTRLLELGARSLEAGVDDLDLADGAVYVRGAPEQRRTIRQLFQEHFGLPVGNLFGSYDFQTTGGANPITGKGKTSAFFFLTACSAEVEVDTETGKVRVVRIATAVDAGKALNPQQCHLQNEGSMLMGLGSALFEELVFDNGQPINGTFLDYMLPSLEDYPREFQSLLVETPHPDGPFGAKGMGESAIIAVAPAIANAVANALGGARVKDMPIRPDRVLAALAVPSAE